MRVRELSISAIKGFGLYHPRALRIAQSSIVGDRAFWLVDASGQMSTANYDGRALPWWTRYEPVSRILGIGQGGETLYEGRVYDGESVRTQFFARRVQRGWFVEGKWSSIISDLVGEPLRLVRAGGGLAGQDVHPISLLGSSSVAALGWEGDGRPVDSGRFRMNVLIDGSDAFAEEGWLGCRIQIGGARLRIVSAAARCSMVQRRAGDFGRELNVLRMMADARGVQRRGDRRSLDMGVYAQVEHPGEVSVGDLIELIHPDERVIETWHM